MREFAEDVLVPVGAIGYDHDGVAVWRNLNSIDLDPVEELVECDFGFVRSMSGEEEKQTNSARQECSGSHERIRDISAVAIGNQVLPECTIIRDSADDEQPHSMPTGALVGAAGNQCTRP